MKKMKHSLQITGRSLAVALTVNPRLRMALLLAALFALNSVSAFAQSTTFNSTDLKTGIATQSGAILHAGIRR